MANAETSLCQCNSCKTSRAQRLQDDLNAMYEKRRLNLFSYGPPPPEKKYTLGQTLLVAVPACLLFFWLVWELSRELARQAGIS